MPTPFYHLALAGAMLADQRLQPSARELLTETHAAFIFGNTAPDVQTMSGDDRIATHFFHVPLRDKTPAYETMFARHSQLSVAAVLPKEQSAFIIGYICHLLLDQLWIGEILEPYFGFRATWENLRERLFLHNVMRIHLDRQDLAQLPSDLDVVLAHVQPTAWLPFVEDQHLRAWRDFLSVQLAPDADIQTVAVFAERMGRAPSEFETLLDSPQRLQTRLWENIPESELTSFRQRALAKSIELVHSYLGL